MGLRALVMVDVDLMVIFVFLKMKFYTYFYTAPGEWSGGCHMESLA